MKTILVVDDDKMILRLATEALISYGEGFNVITASNGQEALDILNSSNIDFVITDIKMPVMDGYELLSHMTRDHRNIPILVMTGFNTPGLEKRLKQKGILHFIEKPFEINLLRKKISDTFAASSKGFIHGFTLANFLQAVEVEQKSITLRIKSESRVGYLYLDDGVLIDAETDDLKSEKAAVEMLCWNDAHIEILGMCRKERTIDTPLMPILLEASKIKDEKTESARPHDDELEEAIRLAEGHHFKEAQAMMANFLKKDPCSFRGWLWCSRIVLSVKSADAFLKRAAKFAPQHPEILEDLKNSIFPRKIKARHVRRCPFCWSLIEMKSLRCHYCKAHLLIHNQFFTCLGEANQDILEKAVERYTRVIGREKNINAYYYLSIAHLNLRHWEETLNLFHKTVKLAPEKKIFSDQLRRLLNHMALQSSSDTFEKRENPVRKKGNLCF